MKRQNGTGGHRGSSALERRLRFGFVAAATLASAAVAGLVACATSDDAGETREPDPHVLVVEDAGAEASSDADASAPCVTDCEYFPPTCSEDVLCSNGLFDPNGADPIDDRVTIQVIRGRSATDVWVVGGGGTQRRFDGQAWIRSELPKNSHLQVGGTPSSETLWLRDGSEVGFTGLSLFANAYSRGLVATADGGVESADGWTKNARPMIAGRRPYDPDSQHVLAGWSVPGAEAFWLATVEPGTPPVSGLVRLAVTDTSDPTNPALFFGQVMVLDQAVFTALHGASADDFWAVGMHGVTLHVTGANDATPTLKHYNSRTRNALHGVWAAAPSDVWAVGYSGTVRHYTGDDSLWELVEGIPESVMFNAIYGTSASDIWAIGNDATVYHYDGVAWSRVKIAGLGPKRPNLVSVWAADPEHVWIGGEGIVLSLGGKP